MVVGAVGIIFKWREKHKTAMDGVITSWRHCEVCKVVASMDGRRKRREPSGKPRQPAIIALQGDGGGGRGMTGCEQGRSRCERARRRISAT